MAAANTASTRCTIAIRLFRSISPFDHDHLTVTRHSHSEPLPHDWGEAFPAGGVPNFPLELGATRHEVGPLALERLHLPRLGQSERAPPDDARCHEDETKKCEGDHRTTPAPPHTAAYSALRHALSRALRERGFRAASPSDAVTGRRVSNLPSAVPRQVHTGWRGGQTQSALQSRNAFFTTRSSPEW